MTVDCVSIYFADVPPSLNRVGSRGSHFAWQKAKKGWQRDVEVMLMAQAVPRGLTRVRVYAKLRFPVRRRRDTGNFQALLEKSVGDALVNGGWLSDDTPDLYSFEELKFEDEPGPARTVLNLVYEEVSS